MGIYNESIIIRIEIESYYGLDEKKSAHVAQQSLEDPRTRIKRVKKLKQGLQ